MSPKDQNIFASLGCSGSFHCNGSQERRQAAQACTTRVFIQWIKRAREIYEIIQKLQSIGYDRKIYTTATIQNKTLNISEVPNVSMTFNQFPSFVHPKVPVEPVWANSLARAGRASSSAIRWLCSSSLALCFLVFSCWNWQIFDRSLIDLYWKSEI